MALAHSDLLAAYRRLVGPGEPWSALPHDEPYIWEHLVYHLRGAGDATGIISAVSDLAFLAVRSFRGGPYAAEEDVRQAVALEREPNLEWLLLLFTQWGHLLAGHTTLGDLAATLAEPCAWPARAGGRPAPDRAAAAGRPHPALGAARRVVGTDACPGGPHRLRVRGGVLAGRAHADQRRPGSHGPAVGPHERRASEAGWRGTRAAFSSLAVSPDGRRLASSGFSNRICLWDLADGRLTATLRGHTGSVNAVAFTPDGTRLASAGEDGTVRRWDPVAEQPAGIVEHGRRLDSVPGLLAGWLAARERGSRPHGAVVGPGGGPSLRRARRPRGLGQRGGVLARRAPCGERGPGRDDPVVGRLERNAHRGAHGPVRRDPRGRLLAGRAPARQRRRGRRGAPVGRRRRPADRGLA